MTREGKGAESVKKLRRKLAKQNHKLRVARDAYAVTRAQGDQRIQEARLEAERAATKSAREVERRAEKVSRLEEMLLAMEGPRAGNGPVSSPESAADILEQESVEGDNRQVDGLTLPESAGLG